MFKSFLSLCWSWPLLTSLIRPLIWDGSNCWWRANNPLEVVWKDHADIWAISNVALKVSSRNFPSKHTMLSISAGLKLVPEDTICHTRDVKICLSITKTIWILIFCALLLMLWCFHKQGIKNGIWGCTVFRFDTPNVILRVGAGRSVLYEVSSILLAMNCCN